MKLSNIPNWNQKVWTLLWVVVFFLFSGVSAAQTRQFEFTYAATIENIPQDSNLRVWLPVAKTSEFQTVPSMEIDIKANYEINRDQKYGNEILYFEIENCESPDLSFEIRYKVTRDKASTTAKNPLLNSVGKQKYLEANRLVPIDGVPLKLLDDQNFLGNNLASARLIYDVVENHMKYDKTQPGYGKGDVLWACDSQTGNCTDFHSLFISLARSRQIPARFEIGFPIPSDSQSGPIKGYHCWAWFLNDANQWVPVDISEADKNPEMKDFYFGNLTADRIAFSNGRDIELVPKNQSGAKNFFVYPHIEINGKQMPRENIDLQFSFREIPHKKQKSKTAKPVGKR